MPSVVQFDKSTQLSYENDLICIFMNIHVNLKMSENLVRGRWLETRPTLQPKYSFSCLPNCLVWPPKCKKKIVLKINPFRIIWYFMVSAAHHAILKNEGVCGSPNEQFGPIDYIYNLSYPMHFWFTSIRYYCFYLIHVIMFIIWDTSLQIIWGCGKFTDLAYSTDWHIPLHRMRILSCRSD